jgi:phosphatidylglycerol:prolipoprotein diacylglycerol transferase
MQLLKINWSPSETLFNIGSFGIHYYSLMFVIAFSLGFYIMKKIYDEEKISIEHLESLFIYMVLSVLLGARLGDVIFYSWDYYQDHLFEILLPIRERTGSSMIFGLIDNYEFIGFRGLASHGAVIGVLIGLYIYQRKFKYKPLIWILDRMTIPISIGAFFVRIGNLFNSEIVGKYTGSNFGMVFLNRGEILPRHPAQLYESFGYLILFFVLKSLHKSDYINKKGFLLGVFFTSMFTIRFLVEFIKETQGGFEKFLPILSTGQWLSIPLIFIGLFFVFSSIKQNKI